MANFGLIRTLAEKKNMTLKDIAAAVGVSDDGLQKIIKKGTTNTKTIEEIAKVLGVQVGVFFDYSDTAGHSDGASYSVSDSQIIYGNAGGHNVNITGDYEKIIEKDRIELTQRRAESVNHLQEVQRLKSEIERLRTIIEAKDEVIAVKNELIETLKNKH